MTEEHLLQGAWKYPVIFKQQEQNETWYNIFIVWKAEIGRPILLCAWAMLLLVRCFGSLGPKLIIPLSLIFFREYTQLWYVAFHYVFNIRINKFQSSQHNSYWLNTFPLCLKKVLHISAIIHIKVHTEKMLHYLSCCNFPIVIHYNLCSFLYTHIYTIFCLALWIYYYYYYYYCAVLHYLLNCVISCSYTIFTLIFLVKTVSFKNFYVSFLKTSPLSFIFGFIFWSFPFGTMSEKSILSRSLTQIHSFLVLLHVKHACICASAQVFLIW
jgi:hypothetical protein